MPVDTTEPLELKTDEPEKEPDEVEGRDVEEGKQSVVSEDSDATVDVQPPEGMEKTEWQALEKKQRDAFLKMSSSKSSRIQELEAEKQRSTQELERRQRIIDEVALKSGNSTTPAPKPLPEFQDMGQLVNYVTETVRQESQREIDQRINAYEQKKAYEDRWVSGWNTVAEKDKTGLTKDPEFVEIVRNELMNSKSQHLKNYNGQNEAEVIQKTVEKFSNFLTKHSDAVKQQTIADMKRKTSTGTEKPGKSISVGKDPKELTKSEIIAEMNAELGSGS